MTTTDAVWLYASLYIFLLLVLTYRVIRVRFSSRVSIGDGGNVDLIRRARAQANFVEYAPFMMLGLIGVSALAPSLLAIHILGGAFLIARICHAIGMSSDKRIKFRQVGMLLTLICLAALALYLLVFSIF